jgi:hypothetical protein
VSDSSLASDLATLADRYEQLPRRRKEAENVRTLESLGDMVRTQIDVTCAAHATATALQSHGFTNEEAENSIKRSLFEVSKTATDAAEDEDLQSEAGGYAKTIDYVVKRACEELERARAAAIVTLTQNSRSVLDDLYRSEPKLVDAFKHQLEFVQGCPLQNTVDLIGGFGELQDLAQRVESRANELGLQEHAELLNRLRNGGVPLSELTSEELEWLRQYGHAERLIVRESTPPPGRPRRRR